MYVVLNINTSSAVHSSSALGPQIAVMLLATAVLNVRLPPPMVQSVMVTFTKPTVVCTSILARAVGDAVGADVGAAVGATLGTAVGADVGAAVGADVGAAVGVAS